MAVAGVIVETESGSCDAVLRRCAEMTEVSVYAIKDNRIVTVIESDSLRRIEETVAKLGGIDHVIGVYPVFTGAYE